MIIKLYRRKGGAIDVTDYVQKVEWGGADTQVSRTASVEFINAPNDGHLRKLSTYSTDILTLTESGKRFFYGETHQNIQKEGTGTKTVEYRDVIYHLIKSAKCYKFRNKTPQYITRKVLADCGIKCCSLPDTKITVQKMIADDWTLYKTIMWAWYKTFRQNGIRYKMFADGARIGIKKKGTIIPNYYLSRNVNITECERTESRENMINKVVIYGDKSKKITTVTVKKTKTGKLSKRKKTKTEKTENIEYVTLQKTASIDKYGVFMAAYHKEKGINARKAAKRMFVGLEQTITLTVIDPPLTCIAGNGVRVYDDVAKLHGLYWIEEDHHTWENKIHTVELTLRFKKIMDTGG